MNIIKVLWCRFQQCWGTFPMLLVEVSSETALFRHLSDSAFRLCNFENTKSMKVNFFPKNLKCNLDFKNATKKWEKVFYFWDNIIWIGIVKLSLLRTWYFPSADNVLRSSTNILHVNKRDFFHINCLGSDRWIW